MGAMKKMSNLERPARRRSVVGLGKHGGGGGFSFAYSIDARELKRRINAAERKNLRAAARLIGADAKRSMRKAPAVRRRDEAGRFKKSIAWEASRPGEPPDVRTGNLRGSIGYAMGKHTVWIGARWPKGAAGPLMEHGTKKIITRAFMGPARRRADHAIPRYWRNSL